MSCVCYAEIIISYVVSLNFIITECSVFVQTERSIDQQLGLGSYTLFSALHKYFYKMSIPHLVQGIKSNRMKALAYYTRSCHEAI